jgi:Flp pilus assembly pilin Flp
MRTLATRFATDQSGAVSLECGLTLMVVICFLVLIAGHVGRQLNTVFKTVFTAERRRRRAPSDTILARSCAVIDLLVRSGYSEAQAIHAVTNRMLAVDITGGKSAEATNWRRLKQWRANLLEGVASEVAQAEYYLFARQLKGKMAREVLRKGLWDRRAPPPRIS